MSKLRVVVVTYLPSPYQVELFNAIAAAGEFDLEVIYLNWTSNTPIARHWEQGSLQHKFVALDGTPASEVKASSSIALAEFVVFNFYQHPHVRRWIALCVERGLPWCLWGERTGYTRWAALGGLYRRFMLAPLHRSRAAVWGIGRVAVEQYRKEFGERRRYFNVPYFSELGRFAAAGAGREFNHVMRRFLFSGAFIPRKGVDLLATAFARVAQEFESASLTLLGAGELEGELKRKLSVFGTRVEFAGFQSWEKLPEFYARADVLVAPSRHDGWALVVPEAMASGMPVIGTTATGAAREFLRTGTNGWLIEPARLDELTRAMRAAARLTPAELRQYSGAARDAVCQHQLNDGVRRFAEAVRGSMEAFAR